MLDPVRELKTRATILHRGIALVAPAALARLRGLAEFRRASDDALVAAAPTIKHKHCLAIVARESGFDTWSQALWVLENSGPDAPVNFGALLYGPGCSGFLNIWFSAYEEACDYLREQGGYLLAYKRQFLVVKRPFISTLGLDPDDPDWALLGWNWVKPSDPSARYRLYGKLLVRAKEAAR